MSDSSVWRAAAQRFIEPCAAPSNRMNEVRAWAVERLRAKGLPEGDDEEYRFTNMNPLWAVPFEMTAEASGGEKTIACHQTPPQGVSVSTAFADEIGSVLALDDPFAVLNTAFMNETLVVRIAPGMRFREPLRLGIAAPSRAGVSFPRALFIFGEGSSAMVTEEYIGESSATSAILPAIEVIIEKGAAVEWNRVQRATATRIVSTFAVRQAEETTFKVLTCSMGTSFIRNNTTVSMTGVRANCEMNGLFMTARDEIIDNHTAIVHAAPNCSSRESFKGILAGASRGIFNGKVFVEKGADKTDAKQSNRTLMLSETAQIHSKPQLEIFADDVKCTHGATVGRLAEDALFYFQSRGIPEHAARRILVKGFASELFERVADAALRESLDAAAGAWLDGLGEIG